MQRHGLWREGGMAFCTDWKDLRRLERLVGNSRALLEWYELVNKLAPKINHELIPASRLWPFSSAWNRVGH